MIDKKNKKEKKILEKLQMLLQMHHLLRAKKVINEDWDEEDLEELLSRAELMEEALKNYMYQFGLSIYQNKQGKYYFKQYLEDDGLRPRDELDDYHFSLREQEPNFIEKLLERMPEEKVMLNTTIESAVIDLYERDPRMAEAFDELLELEMEKCNLFLNESKEKQPEKQQQEEKEILPDVLEAEREISDADKQAEDAENIPDEKMQQTDALEMQEGKDTDISELLSEDVPNSAEELLEEDYQIEAEENDIVYTDSLDDTMQNSYQCGGKMMKKQKLPPRGKIRPLPVPEQILAKDNSKDR